jgi:hypothetical protein
MDHRVRIQLQATSSRLFDRSTAPETRLLRSRSWRLYSLVSSSGALLPNVSLLLHPSATLVLVASLVMVALVCL